MDGEDVEWNQGGVAGDQRLVRPRSLRVESEGVAERPAPRSTRVRYRDGGRCQEHEKAGVFSGAEMCV